MNARRGMHGTLGIALVQLCAVTSCVSTPEDGVGADLSSETGGTGIGGNDGEWVHSTGGTPAVGGSAGSGGCQHYQLDLAEHCADALCGLPDDLSCEPDGPPVVGVTVYRGCGYVRRTAHGTDGYSSTSVWDEATEELVGFHRTRLSADRTCSSSTGAGDLPACDDWDDVCDELGGGGAGGMGGGAP